VFRTLTSGRIQTHWSGAWRLGYRWLRNPPHSVRIGPIVAMMIGPRTCTWARRGMRRSVLETNAALPCGWHALWLIAGPVPARDVPPEPPRARFGIWLFYVQHQFEDAYWEHNGEWSIGTRRSEERSFLNCTRVLHSSTGTIGFHSTHLNARIPNTTAARHYAEFESYTGRADAPPLGRDQRRAVKLWDEDSRAWSPSHEARGRVWPEDTRGISVA